jgi:hypothetical protein
MRLGKEQAAGYVEDSLEDTDTGPIGKEEIKFESSERMPLNPAPEPVTVAG